MKPQTASWKWLLKPMAYLLAATIIFACSLSVILADAIDLPAGGASNWATPSAMSMRRVGAADTDQNHDGYLENVDCSLLTYRQAATSVMRTGCFIETAFGLMDTATNMVIFNGTDEGIPLKSYNGQNIIVPWYKAGNLIDLNPVSTGGTYISLYTGPLGVMKDIRDLLGRLKSKEIIAPADLPLKDPAGNRLLVNAQTMAFSDSGGWLVVEVRGNSFVRINLSSLKLTAFAPPFSLSGSSVSKVAVSDNGRFVAISNATANSFKVYDLTTCDGVVHNLQPQKCASYDYRQFIEQQAPGLRSIRQVRFVNEGLISFEASSANLLDNSTYLLAPRGGITSFTDYIGLGDSYTSGEGAFDYLAGTDTDTNGCHLSRRSYPLLLTDDLFNASGGHSVACSGAKTPDITSTSENYSGQVSNGYSLKQLQQDQPQLLELIESDFLPGFVAQHRFVKRWQPRVVTVSVGGNDIGFGDVVKLCASPRFSRHLSDNTCYNTYEDRLELLNAIDRQVRRWTDTYKQITKSAPSASVYAIGYPQITSGTGNCGLNVQLNKSELEFAEGLIAYLNRSIRKAAAVAKVPYVDIEQALKGHRLCETASFNVAVNGVTAGEDGGPFGLRIIGKESYHPNALGHQLIEQAILQQTDNLRAIPPASDTNSGSTSQLLNAPKTGRPVAVRVADSALTNGLGKRGIPTQLRASGIINGLKPHSLYDIRLDGTTGPVLASVTSDEKGNIDTAVVIPPSTDPGGHSLDITGENQAGELVDVTQPIFVPGSETDGDNDGIENALDTCPTFPDSGQDTDQDGTDDVCDGLITAPPRQPDAKNAALALAATRTTATLQVSGTPLNVGRVLGVTGTNSTSLLHPDSSHQPFAELLPAQPHTLTPHKVPIRSDIWLLWIGFLLLCWILLLIIMYWVYRLISCPRKRLRSYKTG